MRLRCCPHGPPGVVTGEMRGLVLVDWRDLGTLGKHPPASLAMVAPAWREWPEPKPQCRKPAPLGRSISRYQRPHILPGAV